MKKIPTLFVRDPDNRALLLDEVTPGCDWVIAGEGVPTRKYDGTCVMFDVDGAWWARREVKPGGSAPPIYMPISTDAVTGKTIGWEPIEQSSYVKYFLEALQSPPMSGFLPGTYELIGPKINGNPEGVRMHRLIRHHGPEIRLIWVPTEFEQLRGWLLARGSMEGVVWHHPDGRMAKIKRRDFDPRKR